MAKNAIGLGVVAVWMLAGCGDDGGGGGGGGGSVALEDLSGEVAEAFCAAVDACAEGVYAQFVLGMFGGDCVTSFTRQIENTEKLEWDAAIAAGATTYNASKARECVDDLAAAGCDLFSRRMPESCREALGGTVAVGGDCAFDVACDGDSYCKIDGACPGECTARGATGAECDDDDHCASGLNCLEGVCGEPGDIGDPCEGGEPDCRFGVACVGAEDDTPGTCTDPATLTTAALGEACSIMEMQLCDDGLACAVTAIGVGGATMECTAKVAAGASCKMALPPQCPTGQYCGDTDVFSGDIDGTCADLPEAGEPCSGDFLAPCAAGLVCVGASDTSAGTCAARKDNGQSCADGDECYSGACESGTCVADLACDT